MLPDPLDESPATDTRSASEPVKPLVVSGRPLRDVARGIVIGLGKVAHMRLARTEAERDAGLWKFETKKDAGEIADPTVSIVERHIGIAKVPEDLADGVAAIVAFLGYVLDNALESMELRRAERRMNSVGMLPAEPEEQQ